MRSIYQNVLFIIFSGILFSALFLTYNNFNVEIGPITSDKPVLSIDPELFEDFQKYKLFLEVPPYVEIVRLVDTVNLNIPFRIVNRGIIPLSIEKMDYRVRVYGRAALGGVVYISEELLPNRDFQFNIRLHIPIPKDETFINQVFYSNGFINIYLEGVSYLRIGGIPTLKPFEYSIDISLPKMLRAFYQDEDIRFPDGELIVLDIKWLSNGEGINSIRPGQRVTVSITLTSVGDDFEGTIRVYVYKDLVFYPDEIYAGRQYNLLISEGEIKILTLIFESPPEYEFNLTGFYIVIEHPTTGERWMMPNQYPPRLRAED